MLEIIILGQNIYFNTYVFENREITILLFEIQTYFAKFWKMNMLKHEK